MNIDLLKILESGKAFARDNVVAMSGELIEWRDTGTLQGGLIRQLAEMVRPLATADALQLAQSLATRAAFEFAHRIQSIYAKARICGVCDNIVINDIYEKIAACSCCEWVGTRPADGECPGCGRLGTMDSVCLKCELGPGPFDIADPLQLAAFLETRADFEFNRRRQKIEL